MGAHTATQQEGPLGGSPPRSARELVLDLYVSDFGRLLRAATLILGHRQAAEDVVQEAFVRLDRRAEHLNDVEALRAYARAVVVNLSRSTLRRKLVAIKHLPRTPPPAPSADVPVMALLQRDEVVEALGHLPVRQRQALVLRFYEDLSEAEIADAMECKLGTVKATLFQAKRSLARLLGESWEED